MRAIIVTELSLRPSDRTRNKLVKITVSSDKKINVLVFAEQFYNQFFKPILDCSEMINITMPEETYSIYV